MPRTYRVLDLCDESGAFCSRLLAGMGMDVVKIEPPEGDRSRRYGPFLDNVPHSEISLSFWWLNAGKRGVTLDLETRGGLASFRDLAAQADVLAESFQPGFLDSRGAGYRELSASNPGLVMASITGFGQNGPYSGFRASDIVAEAMGGQMSICGDAETPPLRLPGNQAYHVGSLFAATGVLLALRLRRDMGKGQHIDISLQECVASTLDHVLPRYFGLGDVARRQGSLHWNGAFRAFPCRDGHILLSLLLQWDTLVEWLDSERAAEDLRAADWQDPEHRRKGIDHIADVLTRWTIGQSAVELEARGQLMGFPWARVASLSDVTESPQLRSRGFFAVPDHGETGRRHEFPGAPCLLSRTPWEMGGKAPRLREHNSEIMGESRVSEKLKLQTAYGAASGKPPLEGIRVLDLTRVLAGPYATRLLADFGAEVVKVQVPGPEERDAFGEAYYQTWNRNKLSVALDLSRLEGVDIARRLISKSHVLIENFSPRVMANWGLHYEGVRRLRPDIVMVSLSATGQTGPQRDYTGFGPTVHALSGLTWLTAFSRELPLGPGHAYADHVAGIVAALATLAALEHRERTGEGQYVDISETEAVSALLGIPLVEYLANGIDPGPRGNGSAHSAPHGCYRCAGDDSWCVVSVENDAQWRALAATLGGPPLVSDPRFEDAVGRITHAADLDRLVELWTIEHTAGEVMATLQRAGVPAGKVQDAAALASDPQLNFRGFFVDAGSRDMPGLKYDASPIRMSATPARYKQPAPSPDQDREYVMRKILGMERE